MQAGGVVDVVDEGRQVCGNLIEGLLELFLLRVAAATCCNNALIS